jgi:hypothetical protein
LLQLNSKMSIYGISSPSYSCLQGFLCSLIPIIAVFCTTEVWCEAQTLTSQIKKPLIYQIGDIVHINADGPRPLLRALDALQEKYGWGVDYEDPGYSANLNLSGNPPLSPQRRHPNNGAVKSEGLTVEFNSSPASGRPPDEDSVLKMIVDAYNRSETPGRFELRRERDGRFEVVGVAVLEPSGQVVSQQPILDLSITIAARSRSANETVTLICQKLSQKSRVQVSAGDISKIHVRGTIKVGGTNLSARKLLSRMLTATGDNSHWRLLYDASIKSYELDLASLLP